MADYTATAICEGDYWVIDVPGVGTTQADSVDDLEQMAVDLVTAMTHTAPQTCMFRCASSDQSYDRRDLCRRRRPATWGM